MWIVVPIGPPCGCANPTHLEPYITLIRHTRDNLYAHHAHEMSVHAIDGRQVKHSARYSVRAQVGELATHASSAALTAPALGSPNPVSASGLALDALRQRLLGASGSADSAQ